MIDEKKLIENLIPLLNEHGDMYFAGRIIGMIDSQPKIGEWIPCSLRLPEETMYVLVCYKGGAVAVGKYGYNTTHEYKCFWVGYVKEENVIAWQPLPEPYIPRKSESKMKPSPSDIVKGGCVNENR